MAQGVPAAPEARELPERIVFYDGVCAFCNGGVRWLLERDARGLLHYAPLQGETAQALRAREPERFPRDLDTLVFAERVGDELRLSLRSRAVVRILQELDAAPVARAVLRLLPRPVADLAYRLLASVRYRVFGRLDACPLPPPALRGRFLS